MEVLAIIPARGNSKGIPLKNIQPVAGKPLIAHTINAASKATLVDRLIISTDHSQIAEVAIQFGAEVIERPSKISGDFSSSESALLHTLEYLKRTESYIPDLCVFLQCTSPLTLPEDIDGTIKSLINEGGDTALTVTPFHYFLWRHDQTDNAVGINHDKSIRLMRQEREDQFLETGAVYVFRVQEFLEKKHRFFGKTSMYLMPRERCFEIDDPIDMKIAEVLIRENRNQYKTEILPEKIDAVIFDFDGVFTDNSVIVNQNGEESVICDRGDGMGISIIKNLGIPMLVLSSEKNPVVEARCKKLEIDYMQGLKDKKSILRAWLHEKCFSLENTIFLGNDINDIECLKIVGCGIVVQDAISDVKCYANIILSNTGGHGAIRELADMINNKVENEKHAR